LGPDETDIDLSVDQGLPLLHRPQVLQARRDCVGQQGCSDDPVDLAKIVLVPS